MNFLRFDEQTSNHARITSLSFYPIRNRSYSPLPDLLQK